MDCWTGALPCPHDRTQQLADLPTRLAALDSSVQDRLINWGYAVSSAALESHLPEAPARPAVFPYPNGV